MPFGRPKHGVRMVLGGFHSSPFTLGLPGGRTCRVLTQLMREVAPGRSQVVWYDAVTVQGRLRWQNTLNALNRWGACEPLRWRGMPAPLPGAVTGRMARFQLRPSPPAG
jgi:hypothetical protein